MPFKSKRSQSMMGKTNAKKSKQVHGEPLSASSSEVAVPTFRCASSPRSLWSQQLAAFAGRSHARFETCGEQTSTPTRVDRVHGLLSE